MPRINKTKKVKTIKKTRKPVSRALVKAKPAKNTRAYYECMKSCCKGKKISQVAHECKNNALAINAKMSVAKTKAVKKIQAGYKALGQGLSEFIKSGQ